MRASASISASTFALTRVLAALVVLAAVAPAPVRAESLQENIDKAKHDLEQLKATIKQTRKQRDASQKEHETLLQAIEHFDRRLYKARDEAVVVNRDITRLERDMGVMRARRDTLRSTMRDREVVLAVRLRRLYMEGRAGWFRPLLAADSYARFQRRLLYLSTFAARERQLLAAHRRDAARLERLRAQQAAAHASLRTKKAKVERNVRTMNAARSRKHTVLVGLTRRAQSHDQKLAVLTQSENRKETLLTELNRRTRNAARAFRKGALLWPADGPVTGAFGRQKHPTFETYLDKRGIEIATSEGMAIRAVSGGDVVYADWLKGYGLAVILDHGANYFTFYAHASALSVREGDTVAAGVVLGKTGASGLTDRAVLYFELRKGTRPINPLHWFAKR